LNTDEKGKYLGSFEEDKLIIFYKDGSYELTDTEITQRFEPEKMMLIEKFVPEKLSVRYILIMTKASTISNVSK
jgi:topoisomerase-4 subunit A